MDNRSEQDDLLKKIDQLENKIKELEHNEKRLESLLALSQMDNVTEKEIREFALESIVSLTKSSAGYLHFVNDDEKTINLVSWSKAVLEKCTAEKLTHYPVDHAGIWADSIRYRKPVRHNDFQNIPEKKGYPEGHFPVVRHLGVPIFDSEKIVAVAGVGNKESPYDDSDLRQTMLFMNSMWAILKQKKAAEEIKTLRVIIPICSFCKKIRDDNGFWSQVEAYLSEHSEAKFSHGVCPECWEEHYPDVHGSDKK